MKSRQFFLVVVISSICAVAATAVYTRFSNKQLRAVEADEVSFRFAGYVDAPGQTAGAADFTKAASLAVPAIVHIKTKTALTRTSTSENGFDNFLSDFFGSKSETALVPQQRASGSGVIMSEDGYIVTGNHVIADRRGNIASEISVTLNSRKTYKAKLIGRDVANDIAVLKIDEKRLPHLLFGNSDDIQTGQWVLAIGYPFSLDATVTAGIISATGRSIASTTRPVRSGETANRSFIQTDAAVNTGNSGGALVNISGELIGINSGIISPTGTYAGYSFAVPVNAVKKAVKEIIQSSGVPPRNN